MVVMSIILPALVTKFVQVNAVGFAPSHLVEIENSFAVELSYTEESQRRLVCRAAVC